MDDGQSSNVNEDAAFPDDEESPENWVTVTGPISPVRAAAIASAFQQAGIRVIFLQEKAQVSPDGLIAYRAGYQQLAVPEDQVSSARAAMARVNAAFPLDLSERSPTAGPVVNGPRIPATIEGEVPSASVPLAPPTAPMVAAAETEEDKAFEALRVRRYTEGLFVFVIGLVWTLAVLPRSRTDTLLAVVGVVTLCTGLLMIYAALSLRKEEDEDDSD